MNRFSFWNFVRRRSPVVFPIAAIVWGLLVMLIPMGQGSLEKYIASNNFILFLLFWVFGLLLIAAMINWRLKPGRRVILSAGISLAFVALYIYSFNVSGLIVKSNVDLFFACASGSVLGMLAGTWLIYILEVYHSDLDE